MIPRKPHHKGFKKPVLGKPLRRKLKRGETQGDTREPVQKPRRMRPQGTSNRSRTRRSWQSEMVRAYSHETACAWPGCNNYFGIAHAHRLKKRFITTQEEWVHGQVKLCHRHHHYAEYGDAKHRGTHRRMYKLITVLMTRLNRPI